MLSLIQPPVDWWWFAWVAYVPFALACSEQVRGRTVALPAWAIGFVYWLVNLYWIQPITTLGWLGLGLYMAVFWLLLALAVRFSRSKGLPLFIALPILVAGAERLHGFPLGGFYWRFLGHSQYERLAVIQVADLVGTAGVSFVVAMVNGLLADLLLLLPRVRETPVQKWLPFHRSRSASGRAVAVGVVLTAAIVGGTLLYGRWRLRQTPDYVTEGPLVGSLQSNVPQSVKASYSQSDVLFDELMAHSRAAAAAGAELIVWPETMVQGFLEPTVWPYLQADLEEDKAFHRALLEHAGDTAYLLVGAHGIEIKRDEEGEPYIATYNSAFYYRTDGSRDPARYDKIHLVLFGEYIPFKKWLPGVFDRFLPEGYRPNYSLEHGTRYTVFEMAPPAEANVPAEAAADHPSGLRDARQGRPEGTAPTTLHGARHRFAVIICYEDTIPYVARNFTLDEQGRKQIDWLVNISNDGWFVRFLDDPERVIPSAELPQHAAICTFRAVENRLAVVRSVNTGVSCLIDSTGRIRDGYLAASEGFPAEAMERTALSGWFLDRLPIDRRVTFYSRYGEWFADTCSVALAVAVVWPLGAGLTRRRRRATQARGEEPGTGRRSKT